MSTAQSLNPQILGRAENAHRALLERILAGTGVTYSGWVALNLVASNEPAIGKGRLVELLAGALKGDEPAAHETIAGLRNAHLVEPVEEDEGQVRLSEAGRALFGEARAGVQAAVTRLYAGLSSEQLAVAGRVLSVLTTRIEAELKRT